jgi:hypothetical protein
MSFHACIHFGYGFDLNFLTLVDGFMAPTPASNLFPKQNMSLDDLV